MTESNVDRENQPMRENQSIQIPEQYAYTIKLPPFWTSKPDIWFTQIEAQFSVARITNDRRKYDHVLAALPIDVINNIYDVIKNPPDQNLYECLRDTIIFRLSSSEENRLDELLTGSQMGDRKPSDFYRHMLSIVGGSHMVSSDLLLKLWKRRLPKTVFVALTASGKTNTDELIEIADKIWESCQNPIMSQISHAISVPNNPDLQNSINPPLTLSNLSTQLNTFTTNLQLALSDITRRQQFLETQISTLQSTSFPISSTVSFADGYCSNCNNRSRSQTRSSSHSRNKSPNRNSFDPTNNSICYYHQRYKNRAYKCGGLWCIYNKDHKSSNSAVSKN